MDATEWEREVHGFLDDAKRGLWDAVEAWLERSRAHAARVDATPAGRWSALHHAAWCNALDAAAMLLRFGADVRLLNQRTMERPLDIARSKGYSAMVRLMIGLEGCRRAKPPPTEELVACAMALHPRLGRDSLAAVLTPELFCSVFEYLQEPINHRPVLKCRHCQSCIGGLRCAGLRNPELQEGRTVPVPMDLSCGRLLVASSVDNLGMLSCPLGHGSSVIRCCRTCEGNHDKTMKHDENVFIGPWNNRHDPPAGRGGPAQFTCTRCGWTVDGFHCMSTKHLGRMVPLERNPYFERVMSAFVWDCQSYMTVPAHSQCRGKFGGESVLCSDCSEVLGDEAYMRAVQFEELAGPPR